MDVQAYGELARSDRRVGDQVVIHRFRATGPRPVLLAPVPCPSAEAALDLTQNGRWQMTRSKRPLVELRAWRQSPGCAAQGIGQSA